MSRDPGHGFADPVFDSQAVFRVLQDAMSRPGLAQTLQHKAAVDGLSPAAAAILLTLADTTTPVWLAGTHPAAYWLSFHAGARLTAVPAEAQFAVLSQEATAPLLRDFAAGEDCYPDRSATLLVECHDFTSGQPVTLSGPGIKDSIVIAPAGLRPGFWKEARENAARFPLGVDVFFTAGDAVTGLPRSCRIAEIA